MFVFSAITETTFWNIASAVGGFIFFLLLYIIKDFKKDHSKDLETMVKNLTTLIETNHKEIHTKFDSIEKRVDKLDGGSNIETGRMAKVEYILQKSNNLDQQHKYQFASITETIRNLEESVKSLNKEVVGLGANITITSISREEHMAFNKTFKESIKQLNDQMKDIVSTQHKLVVEIAIQKRKITSTFDQLTS